MALVDVPATNRRSLALGVAASLVVFVILLFTGFGTGFWGVSELLSRFSSGSGALDFAWLLLGALVTVGVPVVLYLRLGLLSLVAVLVVAFALWASFDGAGLFFAVFFWPAYVLVYVLVGSVEYLLRSRGVLPALPTSTDA